jgi:carbamoyl-phosphate synthase small subunit
MNGVLILEDGTEIRGKGLGAPGVRVGELVFNTSMTGYQEALTDPSYNGQILMMTYPLIGNYGISPQAFESDRVQAEGFVIREACKAPLHRFSNMDLDTFLRQQGIPCIEGVDTRDLTIKTRDKGTQKSVILVKENLTQQDIAQARELLEKAPAPSDTNLVGEVSTRKVRFHRSESSRTVLLYDCGVKASIIKRLWKRANVIQVPYDFPPEKVRELDPDGILLSNGPGDPAHPRMMETVIEAVRNLKDEYPITGICLGHQMLSLAFKGRTFKLKFGHRGSNHPVKDLETGKIAITSQNHGYAVDPNNAGDGIKITRMNLNDNTVEGLRHLDLPIMSVQYHPEASPGPLDSIPLFDTFVSMSVKEHPKRSTEELLKRIDEMVSLQDDTPRDGRLD